MVFWVKMGFKGVGVCRVRSGKYFCLGGGVWDIKGEVVFGCRL